MKAQNGFIKMSKAHKRVHKYINNKAAGMTKMQAARMAGYSHTASRIPQRIEQSKAYKEIAEMVYNDTSLALSKIMHGFMERVDDGEANKLSLKDVSSIAKDLAVVREKTMPKTMVQFDKDGNVKNASVWGVANEDSAKLNPFAPQSESQDMEDGDIAEADMTEEEFDEMLRADMEEMEMEEEEDK
jgi:hypothetical protein